MRPTTSSVSKPADDAIPAAVLAERDLSDAEYRLLGVLRTFARAAPDAVPSDVTLAASCGWLAPASGRPRRNAAALTLGRLERRGLVRVRFADDRPHAHRAGIDILAPGSDQPST